MSRHRRRDAARAGGLVLAHGRALGDPRASGPEPPSAQLVEFFDHRTGEKLGADFRLAPSVGDPVVMTRRGRPWVVAAVRPARHPSRHPEDPSAFGAELVPAPDARGRGRAGAGDG